MAHHAFSLVFNSIARELITDVDVDYPEMLLQTGKFQSKRTKTRAVWDTGATSTVISPQLVITLGLESSTKTKVRAVNNQTESKVYCIKLFLPNNLIIQNIPVIEGDLHSDTSGYHMLIGMDVIGLGDFHISNAKGKTTFSYCFPPHDNVICLKEKSEAVNKRNAPKPHQRNLKQVVKR